MTASNVTTPKIPTLEAPLAPEKVSDQIESWLASAGDKTLGGLIDMFEEKGFALIFILLLGVPAMPLPTGGGPNASLGTTEHEFPARRHLSGVLCRRNCGRMPGHSGTRAAKCLSARRRRPTV
jgi:hypothetical protein